MSLENGDALVPHADTVRVARLQLDLWSMVFEWRLFVKFSFRRYLMVDSSKVAGHSFVCMREERLRIPHVGGINFFKRGVDLNDYFETRLCPLGTIGFGNEVLVRKSEIVTNMMLMESESLDHFFLFLSVEAC